MQIFPWVYVWSISFEARLITSRFQIHFMIWKKRPSGTSLYPESSGNFKPWVNASGNQSLSPPVGGLERQMLPGPLLVSWNNENRCHSCVTRLTDRRTNNSVGWTCGAILAWKTFCFRNKLQNGASGPLTAWEGIPVWQFGGLNLLLEGCFCTLPAVGREGNLGEATSTP